MLQRIKPLLPAAKVVMILSNGPEISKPEKYMSIGRKIYAGDVMSSESGGAGHIMATGTERLNCSRLPADSAQEAKVIATLNSAD